MWVQSRTLSWDGVFESTRDAKIIITTHSRDCPRVKLSAAVQAQPRDFCREMRRTTLTPLVAPSIS
jgi:hypothetical protein